MGKDTVAISKLSYYYYKQQIEDDDALVFGRFFRSWRKYTHVHTIGSATPTIYGYRQD